MMLKKARLLTRATQRAKMRRSAGKAAMAYHLLRGGWDDPNCARPTRAFGGRALREHKDRPSYPAPFVSVLLTKNGPLLCGTPNLPSEPGDVQQSFSRPR